MIKVIGPSLSLYKILALLYNAGCTKINIYMEASESFPLGVGVVALRFGKGSIFPKSFGKKGAPDVGGSGFCVPSGVTMRLSPTGDGS